MSTIELRVSYTQPWSWCWLAAWSLELSSDNASECVLDRDSEGQISSGAGAPSEVKAMRCGGFVVADSVVSPGRFGSWVRVVHDELLSVSLGDGGV